MHLILLVAKGLLYQECKFLKHKACYVFFLLTDFQFANIHKLWGRGNFFLKNVSV